MWKLEQSIDAPGSEKGLLVESGGTLVAGLEVRALSPSTGLGVTTFGSVVRKLHISECRMQYEHDGLLSSHYCVPKKR